MKQSAALFRLLYTAQVIAVTVLVTFAVVFVLPMLPFDRIASRQSGPAERQILNSFGFFLFYVFLLPFLCFRKDRRFCLSGFAFTRENRAFRWLLSGLLCGSLMNSAAVGAAMLHGDITPVWSGGAPGLFLLGVLGIAVQSGAEELVFRGWCYQRIARKASAGYAVIGSALAFTLPHGFNFGVTPIALLNLFLLGLFLALSVRRTGSVWFAFAFHTAWNTTQSFVFGLPNSGSPSALSLLRPALTERSPLFDPVFGVEGALLMTVLFLAADTVLLRFRKKNCTAANNIV